MIDRHLHIYLHKLFTTYFWKSWGLFYVNNGFHHIRIFVPSKFPQVASFDADGRELAVKKAGGFLDYWPWVQLGWNKWMVIYGDKCHQLGDVGV